MIGNRPHPQPIHPDDGEAGCAQAVSQENLDRRKPETARLTQQLDTVWYQMISGASRDAYGSQRVSRLGPDPNPDGCVVPSPQGWTLLKRNLGSGLNARRVAGTRSVPAKRRKGVQKRDRASTAPPGQGPFGSWRVRVVVLAKHRPSAIGGSLSLDNPTSNGCGSDVFQGADSRKEDSRHFGVPNSTTHCGYWSQLDTTFPTFGPFPSEDAGGEIFPSLYLPSAVR